MKWGGLGMVKDGVEWGNGLGEFEYEGLVGWLVDGLWWLVWFGVRELWGGGGDWCNVGLREEKSWGWVWG